MRHYDRAWVAILNKCFWGLLISADGALLRKRSRTCVSAHLEEADVTLV